MSLTIVNARWQLIVPVSLLIYGALLTVRYGRDIKKRRAKVRLARLSLLATAVLTAWSFLAVIVTMLIHHTAFGEVVTTVLFGTFVATLLAMVCFFIVFALLWTGALFAGARYERHSWDGNDDGEAIVDNYRTESASHRR